MHAIEPVEVICQFTPDGKIIPIKFKMMDKEKIYQEYSIRSYRNPSIYNKKQDGYFDRPFSTSNILDFDCKIEVFGVEKVVRLRYFVNKMEWKILY